MTPAGSGMCHSNDRCPSLARASLAREARKSAKQRETNVADASSRKEAELAARYSDSRVEQAMRCLKGECGVEDEKRSMCLAGCGRGAHLVSCFGISGQRAKVGNVTCIMCRVDGMVRHSCSDESSVGQTLQRSACRSMLAELLRGAESTASNLADYEKLEKEWIAFMSGGDPEGGQHLIEPRYSMDSFLSFIDWVKLDSGRARSFVTIMRSAGAFMAKTGLTNLTALPRAKREIESTIEELGLEPQPCAIPSRRMIDIMLTQELPRVCSTNQILVRSRAVVSFELGGGFRIGEVTGDLHAVEANESFIACPIASNDPKKDEIVVAGIHDSKTKFSRVVAMMGTTRGPLRLETAKSLRELWEISGLHVNEETMDGMRIERPDYWVVRLSLVAIPGPELERLEEALRKTTEPFLLKNVRSILSYLRIRARAKERAGDHQKYINVAGGRKDDSELVATRAWLRRLGLGGRVSTVPGPLIRATDGGTKLTHMPLQPGSTYAHITRAITSAFHLSRSMQPPDTGFDLCGNDPDKPKLGTHWARRAADKLARDTMEDHPELGVTSDLIDEVFGWNQAVRAKQSQLHYRGRVELMKLAKVTMML